MAQWLGHCLWLADYAWSMVDTWVVSAIGQPTRPTQPSIPPGSVNEW